MAVLQLDIATSGPGTAYLFIDNRLGDDVNTDPPNPANVERGVAQWIIDEGWTLVNTGYKPADYTGNNDILGIDESNNATIDQYMSIYAKEVTGNSFTLRTFGEGRNMYGAAFAPIPEPSTLALLGLGAIGLGFLARRRSR